MSILLLLCSPEIDAVSSTSDAQGKKREKESRIQAETRAALLQGKQCFLALENKNEKPHGNPFTAPYNISTQITSIFVGVKKRPSIVQLQSG